MPGPFENYVENKFKKPGPLKGVRVLEVCTLLFGPAGPSFLGQMGAEVIKIELPPLGRCDAISQSFRLVLQRAESCFHAHQSQ